MPTVSSTKISEYYNNYKDQEVYFSRSICDVSGLISEKLKLKVSDEEFPCVLYASSMERIITILNLTDKDMEKVRASKGLASVKFSFFPSTVKKPFSFFISCRIKKINSFKLASGSAFIITMDFNQRPPDDFIEIIGNIIENSVRFNNRKELRIRLDDKIVETLGMDSIKGFADIDENFTSCVFADISTSGCGIVMTDSPEIEDHKRITIQLKIRGNPINISGVIVRSEKINNRPDLIRLGVLYEKEEIPYVYKNMINNYLDMLAKIKKQQQLQAD